MRRNQTGHRDMHPQTGVNPERLKAFSDGVFAVIITILVLDLRPPSGTSWEALLAEWPVAVSYAVSYLFVAIVWINHHYVVGFAESARPRLIWVNFAHLFTVSLLPFSTAWIADTRLAAGVPVFIYAAVFFLVNLTYILLCSEGQSARCESPAAENAPPDATARNGHIDRFRHRCSRGAVVPLGWLRSCLLLPRDVSASAGARALMARDAQV